MLLYCGLSSHPGGNEKLRESALFAVGSAAFRGENVGGVGADDCCSVCSWRRLFGVVDRDRKDATLVGL